REVRDRFRIRLQALSVRLIRSQAVECDETPCLEVRALVREKISDEMAAAAGDDAAPVRGVLPEIFLLERIDLIANEAGDGHSVLPITIFSMVVEVSDRFWPPNGPT